MLIEFLTIIFHFTANSRAVARVVFAQCIDAIKNAYLTPVKYAKCVVGVFRERDAQMVRPRRYGGHGRFQIGKETPVKGLMVSFLNILIFLLQYYS